VVLEPELDPELEPLSWEELVAEPDVVPALAPEITARPVVGPTPRWDASKPKRRTTTEIVLRIQNEMRRIVSPAERLEMEPVLGKAGANEG
jgi:hypothetical protein